MGELKTGRYISLILISAGLILMAQGLWLTVKPLAADVLLKRSWAQSIGHGQPQSPWPGLDSAPIAELTVAALDIRQIVLDKASGQALAFAPAHLVETGPIGGNNVAAIAAHKNTHFAFLKNLEPGMEILVRTIDGKLHVYQAGEGQIINTNYEALSASSETAGLVLITCYPFDAISFGSPFRYVVPATKVG